MKVSTCMYFPQFEEMDFCVTEAMLATEKRCCELLERLKSDSWYEDFMSEAECSAAQGCASDDPDIWLSVTKRATCRRDAAYALSCISDLAVKDIVYIHDIVCEGHYYLTDENMENITKLFYASEMKEFADHPIIKAAFLHTAIMRIPMFKGFNNAMADLLVYHPVQKRFPAIWKCHPSYVVNKDYVTEYYDIILRSSETNAMEAYITLLYRAICFALVKQEVGDESKYSRIALAQFLRYDNNVDKFIKEVL